MAVQIPDPGTGNGQTGDNEYVFRKKVRDNFSDQTHAASRLVGKEKGNLLEVGSFGLGGNFNNSLPNGDFNNADLQTGFYKAFNATGAHSGSWVNFLAVRYDNSSTDKTTKYIAWTRDRYGQSSNLYTGGSNAEGELTPWHMIYTEGNTTKDSNGFLKAASPIVKVFADKVELNSEAEYQDISYKKNGVGDYTITTQSGLSTDGWYIELPKDINGNPKVAVTLEEEDGVISLKTYKRVFSMETFTFEPDLDNPLDIPDTRWIDLRLNEIPVDPSELESEV